MSSGQSQTESLDMIKIYIWVMSALCIVTLIWLLSNYFLLSKYKAKVAEGRTDLEKIIEIEPTLPPKSSQGEPQTIQNVFNFFKRTLRDISEPEVEESNWEPGNIAGVSFSEKRYTIRFEKGISRRDLARYIYKICESASFLKVKSLDLQKTEGTQAHVDNWKAEVVFAYRKSRVE
ncbi:MAG: hypothetical protein HUU50_08710 [Candidatus Brocadiae bacterium]|nr:hypothetical protein [Candidatus Brocadiia bacterium]